MENISVWKVLKQHQQLYIIRVCVNGLVWADHVMTDNAMDWHVIFSSHDDLSGPMWLSPVQQLNRKPSCGVFMFILWCQALLHRHTFTNRCLWSVANVQCFPGAHSFVRHWQNFAGKKPVVNSVVMYCMKHSSHRSLFWTKQLSIGQHRKANLKPFWPKFNPLYPHDQNPYHVDFYWNHYILSVKICQTMWNVNHTFWRWFEYLVSTRVSLILKYLALWI